MNVTKLVAAVAAGLLGLGAVLGVPGADSPDVAAFAEKLSGSVAALITGWLFFRQEWLGQGKQPQAPKAE